MIVSRESHGQSVGILSYDRIFSYLLAGVLRGHFPITIDHDPKPIAKRIELEEMTLLLGDSALLNESLMAALRDRRTVHHGLPHVLLFLSPTELESMDVRYQACIDRILVKPAGTEDILTAVWEITMQG